MKLISRPGKLVDGLLYSNLFIAACAAAYVLTGFRLSGSGVWNAPLLAFSAGSTLFLYLALRWSAGLLRPDAARAAWTVQHRVLSMGLMGLGAVSALLGFWFLPRDLQLAVLPAGFIALAYGWPFLPVSPRWKLRSRNFLKIFLISGVWAWIGAVLPAVAAGAEHSLTFWLCLFASRFFFAAGITLPFDIRDIEEDQVYRLETVATAFGVQRTRTLAGLSLAASWIGIAMALFLFSGDNMLPGTKIALFSAVGLSILAAAWGVAQAHPDGREYHYLGLLDGTILIQWILVEGVFRCF